MMIKLNPRIKTVRHYDPPVPVVRHFDDIDIDAPHEEQINCLLWIPATLVSRFLGQFPCLENEADELFSIGMLRVCQVVAQGGHAGDKIGAVCNVQCRYDMETYANNLNSIVKVSSWTRYQNKKAGVRTPNHVALPHRHPLSHTDDHTELEVRDAAEALGYDLTNMTLRQKRHLHRVLS